MAIEQGVGDSTNYSPVLEGIEATLIEQTALAVTLNSLTETLQELSSRLMVIASMANSGTPALRIIPAAATIPVSGSLTSAGTVSTVTSLGTLTNMGVVPATLVGNAENNILAQLGNTANAVA